MPIDTLVLNSGEWRLADELAAEPWHILIYRQRSDARNELHVWLPKNGTRGGDEYAFRRYWMEGEVRWCVELPRDPDRFRGLRVPEAGEPRLRFSTSDGKVLWTPVLGEHRLGDFTDLELMRLKEAGVAGPYGRI